MSHDAPRRSSAYSTVAHRRSVSHNAHHALAQPRRSRSHSAVRDNANDVRRHLSSVAQNTTALAQKFTEHLQAYKTFAPLFATDGVYAMGVFPFAASPLTAIDQILETRGSFLVRHRTHHRIVPQSTGDSTGSATAATAGADATPAVPPRSAHQRLQSLERDINQLFSGMMAPAPPPREGRTHSNTTASVTDNEDFSINNEEDLDDPVYRVWLREHPNATRDEREAEKRRRHAEQLAVEKAQRARYLRRWQTELQLSLAEDEQATAAAHNLSARDTAAERSACESPAQSSYPTPRPPPQRRPSAYDIELQKLTWTVFARREGSTTAAADLHAAATPATASIAMASTKPLPSGLDLTAAPSPGTGDAATTTTTTTTVAPADPNDDELHQWVQGAWVHHTHRHEAAALMIQCAFRRYLATTAVARARYLRLLEHAEALKSEEEAMFAWRVAQEMKTVDGDGLSSQSGGPGNPRRVSASASDAALEKIHFFVSSVTAKAQRRRAERERRMTEAFELQSYAAVRIQAVYRGHVARRFVHELRHPEIGARRRLLQETQAALNISRFWRGHISRTRVAARRFAAKRIQCWFRRAVAMATLNALRRAARQREIREVRDFASTRIARAFRRYIGRKRQRYAQSLPKLQRVFAAGRGYLARREAARLRWTVIVHHVTTAQAAVRGFLARVSVRRLRDEVAEEQKRKRREQSATVIQRNLRGALARQRTANLQRQHNAARRIQGAARGYLAKRATRKILQQKRDLLDLSRQHDAASLIQAVYRGHASRKVKKSSQLVVPQLYRGKVRSAFARMHRDRAVASSVSANSLEDGASDTMNEDAAETSRQHAARTVQAFYFSAIRARRFEQSLRAAVLTVSQFMRRLSAYKAVAQRREEKLRSKEDEAAAGIQQAVRSYLARNTVAALRQQRDENYQAIREEEALLVMRSFLHYCLTKQRIRAKKGKQTPSSTDSNGTA